MQFAIKTDLLGSSSLSGPPRDRPAKKRFAAFESMSSRALRLSRSVVVSATTSPPAAWVDASTTATCVSRASS